MKIVPVMTEKSMGVAQTKNKFTFWVPADMSKPMIKEVINKAFGVNVREVQTQKYKAHSKTNIYRKKVGEKARKRAMVTLREKESIELFQADKKSKKK